VEEVEVERHGTFEFGTFIELAEVRRLYEMRYFPAAMLFWRSYL
jgi:uncharacterized glyoxalase superfamily metalloenzyme YdcJ